VRPAALRAGRRAWERAEHGNGANSCAARHLDVLGGITDVDADLRLQARRRSATSSGAGCGLRRGASSQQTRTAKALTDRSGGAAGERGHDCRW